MKYYSIGVGDSFSPYGPTILRGGSVLGADEAIDIRACL